MPSSDLIGKPIPFDVPSRARSPRQPSRATLCLLSALLLILWPFAALGQDSHYAVPAASVQDQFWAYQQTLSAAADRVLADAESGCPTHARCRLESGSSPTSAGTTKPDELPSPAAVPLDDDVVRRFALQYWNGEAQHVRRAVDRVARLRTTLDSVLAEENVPRQTAALVLVESGGRPAALSSKGALGLWQFMPETARQYGLTVGGTSDERLDIVKSTRAAARYLRQLYARFGDWRLAFAAYNAGEGAVEQAVARAGDKDFSHVRGFLPRETRSYVPAVVDAIALFANAPPPQISTPADTLVYAVSR